MVENVVSRSNDSMSSCTQVLFSCILHKKCTSKAGEQNVNVEQVHDSPEVVLELLCIVLCLFEPAYPGPSRPNTTFSC